MNRALFALILTFSVTAAPICAPQKYRLSTIVKPTFYSLKIHPQFDEDVFTGEVFMHVKISTPVEFVELHANSTYLTLKSVYFDSERVQDMRNRSWCTAANEDFGYKFLDFELLRIVRKGGQLFPPGSHVLYFKFKGKYSKPTAGLFRVDCTNEEVKPVVATDFETGYARTVFPCFDEPAFKAKFQLNLVVPNNSFIALSNMRAKETYNTSEGVAHNFESTPLMSTYLLSFAVTSHVSTVSYTNAEGLPFRIYSCENSSKNDTKLLEFASKVVNFYANYTQFNYTLPKIDFLGFDRIDTSATENWGLVTFNTSLVSSDELIYEDAQKMSVIAHELAHFWFGNLVTNEWWDDIWLQESFATFMSLKAEESVLNNNASRHFPVDYSENLFYYEQSNPTFPVINFQEDPEKIRDNFNDVTYIKGTNILRMLEATIGKKKLHQILVEYIRKHAFGVATTDDFLSIVLDVTSDDTVREFLASYLYQNQFPVISVFENEENYVLYQSVPRFGENDGKKGPFGHKWTIPISYITDLEPSPRSIWFRKDMEKIQLSKNNSQWIKLNHEHIGYYRVVYSDTLWDKLIKHSQDLKHYERDHLLFDAIAMFEIEMGSCDVVLKYLWEVSKQPRFNVEIAATTFQRLKILINDYKVATYRLKRFFEKVKQRSGRFRYITKILPLEPNFSSDEMPPKSEQVKKCIDWLEQESPQYYANSTKSVNESTPSVGTQ